MKRIQHWLNLAAVGYESHEQKISQACGKLLVLVSLAQPYCSQQHAVVFASETPKVLKTLLNSDPSVHVVKHTLY